VYETLVGFKETPDMQMAIMQNTNEGFDLGEKQRYSTAPGGFGNQRNNIHDHAN